MTPSSYVLDLFAVPDAVEPLPGGQGGSVLAGDLVLSPDRDPGVLVWLQPLLARLAVELDQSPRRGTGDVRIAMPVPARDGSWTVEGWAASRYEPGTRACRDLDVVLAAGRLLHARFAVAFRERPAGLDDREDRWARAERAAFGPRPARRAGLPGDVLALVEELEAALEGTGDDGPSQLVHTDLAGNVLLDADDVPVVIDVSPAWRPARWAEAVAVLDAVVHQGAGRARMEAYAEGPARTSMLRAALFRVLGDRPADVPAYRQALAGVL
ncbi:MAG: aminoglycoside phosphotransferase [Marmoricola sp.]|nr:aminoglycoside phosphotransferase [Marmoricola sp.]